METFFSKRSRIIKAMPVRTKECPRCEGVGRINHRCGMGACVDDECDLCGGNGRLPIYGPTQP